jgi:hypothetical protein
MAEVVMDDMAIGNPVSPLAQLGAFGPAFPGIHKAQFHFQVIGNCGLIFLMQCSKKARFGEIPARLGAGKAHGFAAAPLIQRFRNAFPIWPLALGTL